MIIFALFSRTPRGVLSDKGNIVFLTLEYYITCCYAPVNWYVKQFSMYTDFLASTCRLKLYDGGRKLLNAITCLRFLASSTGDMTTTTAQDNGKMVRFIKWHETQAKEITLLGQIQKEIGWNFPSFNVTMSLLGLPTPPTSSSTSSSGGSQLAFCCSPSLSPFNSIFYFSEWLL